MIGPLPACWEPQLLTVTADDVRRGDRLVGLRSPVTAITYAFDGYTFWNGRTPLRSVRTNTIVQVLRGTLQ